MPIKELPKKSLGKPPNNSVNEPAAKA